MGAETARELRLARALYHYVKFINEAQIKLDRKRQPLFDRLRPEALVMTPNDGVFCERVGRMSREGFRKAIAQIEKDRAVIQAPAKEGE